MLRSLGENLTSQDFIKIALGKQHAFVILQNGDIQRPLVVPYPTLLQAIASSINIPAGSAAWGSILTGTGVASQTDLITYLNNNYYPLSSNPASYVTASQLATTLLGYVTTSALATALLDYVTNSDLITILSDYVTDLELAAELASYTTISDRLILIKNGGGTAVTGVITNTVSQFLELPANSIEVGDSYIIRLRAEKTGAFAAFTMRLYKNSSPDLTGSPLLIGTYQASATQTSTYLVMRRQYDVESSTATKSILSTQSVTEDVGNGFTQSYNIDYTVQNYYVATLQNNSASDSTIITSMSLIKLHQI